MFQWLKKRKNKESEALIVSLPTLRLTERQLANGVLCLGAPSSGKTTCVRDTILAAEIHSRRFSGFIVPVKQSDPADSISLFHALSAIEDVISWGEETGHRCNFFEYQLRQPNSVSTNCEIVVQSFQQLREISSHGSRSGDRFWEEASNKQLRDTVFPLALAYRTLDAGTMARFMRSAPLTHEQRNDPAWRDASFYFQTFSLALKNANTASEIRELEICLDSWNSRIDFDWKTRTNVDQTCYALLDPLIREAAAPLISGESTFDPHTVMRDRKWVVPLFTILGQHEPARYALVLAKFFFLRTALAREVTLETSSFSMVCDEAQLTTTKFDAEACTVGRSQKLCPMYLTQGVNPLRALSGDAELGRVQADTLLQTLGIKVFCANSCSDTNQWASEVIGSQMTAVATGNWQHGEADDWSPLWGGPLKSSGGFHMQNQPLVFPIEFSRLQKASPALGYCETIVHGVPFESGRPSERVCWPMRIR